MKRIEFRKALPNPILQSGNNYAIALFSREVVRYIKIRHKTKHPNIQVHHGNFYDVSLQVHYLRIDWYLPSNISYPREVVWQNNLNVKPLIKKYLWNRKRRLPCLRLQ